MWDTFRRFEPLRAAHGSASMSVTTRRAVDGVGAPGCGRRAAEGEAQASKSENGSIALVPSKYGSSL